MSKIKHYEDIARAIKYVKGTYDDTEARNEVLMLLNEAWALRNAIEVQGIRQALKMQDGIAISDDDRDMYRTGIYDPEVTKPRDITSAIARKNVTHDDFIIVDSDCVAVKFFNGEFNKFPTKKTEKKKTEPQTGFPQV